MDEQHEGPARFADLAQMTGAALAFANSLRARDNRSLLPSLVQGVPHDCRRCVVAATANEGLGPREAKWEIGAVAIKVGPLGGEQPGTPIVVPDDVSLFLAAFDAQELPELIEDGAAYGEPFVEASL